MGVKPEPLASVPEEPPLPESSRKRTGGDNMAWFEQQDLTILKAWNNDIVEIQPELSMFGSLKVVDVRIMWFPAVDQHLPCSIASQQQDRKVARLVLRSDSPNKSRSVA